MLVVRWVVSAKAMLEQRKLALAERTRRIRQVLASAKPSGDMKKAEDADVANERYVVWRTVSYQNL